MRKLTGGGSGESGAAGGSPESSGGISHTHAGGDDSHGLSHSSEHDPHDRTLFPWWALAGGGLHGAPSLAQCREIGRALAQLHLAGEGFPQRRDNDRGPRWCQSAAERVLPLLDRVEAHLLNDELAALTEHPRSRLPQGTIHADLFRDNALFDGDRLCGLIDFYYACTDALAFDVAVTVNDWCTQPDGTLDRERADALYGAYATLRPFSEAERAEWPRVLRAAALRFWLSRLVDKLFPTPGELTFIKDPDAFKHILIAHRGAPWVPA